MGEALLFIGFGMAGLITYWFLFVRPDDKRRANGYVEVRDDPRGVPCVYAWKDGNIIYVEYFSYISQYGRLPPIEENIRSAIERATAKLEEYRARDLTKQALYENIRKDLK